MNPEISLSHVGLVVFATFLEDCVYASILLGLFEIPNGKTNTRIICETVLTSLKQ